MNSAFGSNAWLRDPGWSRSAGGRSPADGSGTRRARRSTSRRSSRKSGIDGRNASSTPACCSPESWTSARRALRRSRSCTRSPRRRFSPRRRRGTAVWSSFPSPRAAAGVQADAGRRRAAARRRNLRADDRPRSAARRPRCRLLHAAVEDGDRGGRIYDAHIAEVARAAGATVIVTDNRRHFLAALRHGIRVETPAEYLRAIKPRRS